jgi:membrane protease YdiL (CAAX protease family)
VSLVAWLAILPASPFAAIICDAVLSAPPPAWLPFLNVIASAALLALAYVLPGLRPIRGYLRSVALLTLGYLVVLQMENTRAWRLRFDHAPAWRFVFADAALELIPCLLLTLGLIRSSLTRGDLFLARGNLSAPFPMPFHLPSGSWAWLGPFLTLFLAGPLVLQLVSTVRPDFHLLRSAVQGLPLALAFAVYNAAQEEYRFRAVLLGQLTRVVGASQALWMTSALFRSRPLVRPPVRTGRRRHGRVRRPDLGQEHAGHARLRLGVDHPRVPGPGHFQLASDVQPMTAQR